MNFQAIECQISCFDLVSKQMNERMGIEDESQEVWMDCIFDMSKAIAIKPRGTNAEAKSTTVIFEHDSLVTNLTWQKAREYFYASRRIPPYQASSQYSR